MRFFTPARPRAFALLVFFAVVLFYGSPAFADQLRLSLSAAQLAALEEASDQFRIAGSGPALNILLPTANGSLEARVRPFDIRSEDYRSQITGPNGPEPDMAHVDLFTGSLDTKDESDFVRLTLVRKVNGEKVILGFFRANGEMYSVNSSSASGLTVPVEQLSAAALADLLSHCGVTHTPDPTPDAAPGVSATRIAELATDADFEYFQAKSSNASSVNAYILSLVSAISAIYESQVAVQFEVTFQNVWSTSDDPYTSTASGTLLEQFRSYWASNFSSSQRYDLAHLWTGKNIDGSVVGIAYLGVVCSSARYGLSQILTNASFEVPLTAHEIGHNFNSDHDTCNSGEQFIMCPFVIQNVSQFSPASDSVITSFAASASCLSESTPPPTQNPPVLASIGARTVAEYSTLNLSLSASDPDGGTLTFSFSPTRSGMSLSGSSFSYTPPGTVVTNGSASAQVSVTITVTDPSGLTDSETVVITVTSNNLPPVLASPGSVSGAEGSLISIQLSASDPDGDSIAYSAPSGLPAGAVLTSGGLLQFRPAGNQSGTYNIAVRASDSSGAEDNDTLTLIVSDTTGVSALPARHARPDFDGDGLADVSVFRYRTGEWFSMKMFPGPGETYTSQQWGLAGDVPVPGDYNGDKITDYAVFRTGDQTWYILHSGIQQQSAQTFGLAGDIPSPGDFDGDGRWDLGVFRPSSGSLFYLRSSDGTTVTVSGLGAAGDVPAPCDFDGDGKFDVTLYRPTTGTWSIMSSATGLTATSTLGRLGDIPTPGDYEGTVACERAVWRPSEGTWYVESNTGIQFGLGEDVPVPADYDGDGKLNFEVFRPSFGSWFFRNGDDSASVTQLGLYYDQVSAYEALAYAFRNSTATSQNTLSTDPRSAAIYEVSTQQLRRVTGAGSSSATIPANPGSYVLSGDYDGDGQVDAAVYGSGLWIVYQSFAGIRTQFWGTATDLPVAGDFDGDGKTDITVFRPDAGGGFSAWYAIRSSDGGISSYNWGLSGDIPVPADFDGDGFTDPSVWRDASGYWFVMSGRASQQIQAVQWGLPGDLPRVADFDGDGRADRIAFRQSTGIWYLLPSSGASPTGVQWGLSGDLPIPGRYVSASVTEYAVYRASTASIYIRTPAGTLQTLGTGLSTAAQAVGFTPQPVLR